MKHFLLSFFLLAFGIFPSWAADENIQTPGLTGTGNIANTKPEIDLNDISIDYKNEVYLGEMYTISTDRLQEKLSEFYPESELRFSWDIISQSSQNGETLEIEFSSPGEKQISLKVYEIQEGEESLIFSRDFFPFVYEYSIPAVFDSGIEDKDRELYKKTAESLGILIFQMGNTSEEELGKMNLYDAYKGYLNEYEARSNYTLIWGSREFIFSTLGEFEAQGQSGEKMNFVLMSSYNNSILQNFIENSVAGKTTIGRSFVIDDIAKSQLLKHPLSINELMNGLDATSHEYHIIDTNIQISPILFISRFIQELSLGGVMTSDIYVILLIPFLLTLVSVAKHIIGIGSMGVTTPVFLTIMLIKLGIFFTLSIILFLFFFNVLLGRILNKYTLLYTPKINFITIVNIIFFMLFYVGLQHLGFANLQLENLIYVILFFLVSERIISVIITKEYREYKKSIWGTIAIALTGYGLFYLDSFLAFIFSYPEIILLLAPVNFMIGRFTGLRITEYFRFHEIIKRGEEE